MIISLTKTHPAAEQLATLAQFIRSIKREEEENPPQGLSSALNLVETNHGNGKVSYNFAPGEAPTEDAISSYQYIRKYYPSVLDILCHAASRGHARFTVEIGVPYKQDTLSYSQHELLRIMPRILAMFRGTVQQT